MDWDNYDESENIQQPTVMMTNKYIQLSCGEKVAFADLQGRVKIPAKAYEWIFLCDEFIFVKDVDRDCQVFDIRHGGIDEIEYESMFYEEDEFVAVKVEGHWMFADLTEAEYE